jgi:hypothetical protein
MPKKLDVKPIFESYLRVKRESHNKNNKNKICVECGCHLEESYVESHNKLIMEETEESGQTDCNGVIIFRGHKFVCIAVGLMKPSSNEKTGHMVQVYIIPSDILPSTAVKLGKDAIVCFNCKHRGTTCYVNVGQGVDQVYKSFERGNYPELPSENGIPTNLEIWKGLFEGTSIRFGAYGEPVRIPLEIVKTLTSICGGRITGYTHQWKTFPDYKKYFMASVDNPQEYKEAKALGWRTFRVSHTWHEKDTNENFCKFNLDGTKCIDCLKCRGLIEKDKDIFVKVHGTVWKTNAFVENMAEDDFQFPPMTPEEKKIALELDQKAKEAKKPKPTSALDRLLQSRIAQRQHTANTNTSDYIEDLD